MSLFIEQNRALLKNPNTNKYYIPYVNNASSQRVGVVKSDGRTTSVDSDGVMKALGSWSVSYANETLTFTSLSS